MIQSGFSKVTIGYAEDWFGHPGDSSSNATYHQLGGGRIFGNWGISFERYRYLEYPKSIYIRVVIQRTLY